MRKIAVILALFSSVIGWAESDGGVKSWTEEYTVGAGDAFKIELYGKPETIRPTVAIQPDGTITYLQVQNLPVTGLTIDGLREALQKELERSYKNVEVVVQPVTLGSKRFFVLGRVTHRGSYVLDRPLTIMEAVATAGGFESGIEEPTTAGLADLSRAFLVRNGERVKVDFEKLFLKGDFAQNITIEPNDYLYFPSEAAREVYVLGAVNNPGKLSFMPGATVMASLAASGSFDDTAFRDRVLVIRGSLTNPETIVVDCNDILKGRAIDVKLEPKDIVFVSTRPWKIAEDLLDFAVTAFVRASINAWVGNNIILGRDHVLPQINP